MIDLSLDYTLVLKDELQAQAHMPLIEPKHTYPLSSIL